MGKPIIWSGINAKLINPGDFVDRNNTSLTQGAKLTVTQTGHGFFGTDIGCPLYLDVSGVYAKARADNPATAQVAGFIYSIISSNVFVLATSGKSLTIGSNFLQGGGFLSTGTTYYLSDISAGKVTDIEPTTSGYVSKPLGVALSATDFLFINQRGNVIGGSVSGTVPVGTIVAYNPGYYTNNANAGFTVTGPSTNTEAAINTFLNPDGWFVCDGNSVSVPSSPIWNAAGRFLPKLNDSRFLSGSTTAGSAAGANSASIAHTHSVTTNVTAANHTLVAANIPTVSTTYTPAGTVDIQHSHGSSNVTYNKQDWGTNQNGHSHSTGAVSGTGFVSNGTSGTPGTGANITTGGGGYLLSITNGATATWTSTVINGTAAGQTLAATNRNLTGTAATISVGNAVPTAFGHTLTNNTVTSGAASVTSINTVPQYLSSFYIIRVF